ncbi:MAG: GNAT family N-acetyltransferase [Candidatus Thorarchaeota archaeon]|nr:GNAT family N-acetyltransferase [Candidatus Thorarchaeota archaeon]
MYSAFLRLKLELPLVEWISPDKDSTKALFSSVRQFRTVLYGSIDHELGTVYVDSIEHPKVAWWSFKGLNTIAGDSASDIAWQVLTQFPYRRILNIPNKNWEKRLRSAWGEDLFALKRTQMSEESLDLEHIRKLKTTLPKGFRLERANRILLEKMGGTGLDSHIHRYFGSIEAFLDSGIGFCIVHNEDAVCMASTFSPFSEAFEVEIETVDSPKYRRKGLATVAASALIEYALGNRLIPHWDAQTEISVKLAEKLGYSNPEPYEAYIRVTHEDREKLIKALA